MVNQEIRNEIFEVSENAVVFDDPAFDNSIIGIDVLSDAVVYSYDLMVKELASEYMVDKKYIENFKGEMSDEEFEEQCETDAMEFIDFNTLRSLQYIANDPECVAPVIVGSTQIFDFIKGGNEENEKSKEN